MIHKRAFRPRYLPSTKGKDVPRPTSLVTLLAMKRRVTIRLVNSRRLRHIFLHRVKYGVRTGKLVTTNVLSRGTTVRPRPHTLIGNTGVRRRPIAGGTIQRHGLTAVVRHTPLKQRLTCAKRRAL